MEGDRPCGERDSGHDDGVDEAGGKTDEGNRRPGDIWTQDLGGQGQAALDIAVTNGMGGACVEEAASQKGSRLRYYENYKRNYKANRNGKTTDEQCRERGILFVPLIIEAHGGGFGHALQQVIKVIAEDAAGRWNKNPEAVARRTAQRLSFLTHTENAQAVLDRLNAELVTDYDTPVVL